MTRLDCYDKFYEISGWLTDQCYFVRRDYYMYPAVVGGPIRPIGFFDFEVEEQAMVTLLRFGECLKVKEKPHDPLTVKYQ